MLTLFEQQGGTYQTQGDYFIPYVVIKDQKEVHIGVWANRHRQYLKQFHRVWYYNLLTSEKLYEYLSDIEEQAEKMFEELVKSLAEKENVTEKLKADKPMLWVRRMNNIRNRATEIVNSEIIYKWKSGTAFGEKSVGCVWFFQSDKMNV